MRGAEDAIQAWLSDRLRAREISDAVIAVDDGRAARPDLSSSTAWTYTVDVLMPAVEDPRDVGDLIGALARDLEVDSTLGGRLGATSAGRLGPIKGAVRGRLIFELEVS